jgi:crotonobetainyl-CoA:carnitine CoA-transferase CaiB-like acyl-CoA transferase
MGAMYLAAGIMAAVFWRNQSGRGQLVSTSTLRSMVAAQQNYITHWSDPSVTTGFSLSHLSPPGPGMATKDGRIETSIGQAARDPALREAVMKAFGLVDRWAGSALNNGQSLDAVDSPTVARLFEEALKDYTTADAVRMLEDLNIRSAPWHNYETMFNDPGVIEQDVLTEVSHSARGDMRTASVPWKLGATPGAVRLAPPVLGEHTDEVLAGIGYSPAQIEDLRASGVVG